MAAFSLIDAILWVHDQDVGGSSNKLMLKPSVDDLDSTVFGLGGYRRRVGGLKTVELSGDGYADTTATPDDAAFAALGVADRAATVGAFSTEGSVAYAFQAGEFSYEQFAGVGELAPFTVELKGTNKAGLVRGQIAKAKGNVSATGVLGTAQQLGNVAAGQSLYAVLHVFGVGTSITVLLESDDNAGFSSPTTRATINGGPITAAAGYWATPTPGALTETHYRLRVSAITGTFLVAGFIGIG